MRTVFRTGRDPLKSTRASQGVILTYCIGVAMGGYAILMMAHKVLGFGASMSSVLPALILFLGTAGAFAYDLRQHYPHDQLGLCNAVTLSRLVIVAVLAVAVFEVRLPDVAILGLALFSLCLDGVDGWLARRHGLVSEFGARFDMQVDAVFALTLALYAAVTGVAERYVIILGVPYYVFALARQIWPWLGAPLPDSFARKTVCVAQIAVLIAFLVPWLPGELLNACALAVSCALFWSFVRDIVWLSKRRAA